jgi:hypothetical protein
MSIRVLVVRSNGSTAIIEVIKSPFNRFFWAFNGEMSAKPFNVTHEENEDEDLLMVKAALQLCAIHEWGFETIINPPRQRQEV